MLTNRCLILFVVFVSIYTTLAQDGTKKVKKNEPIPIAQTDAGGAKPETKLYPISESSFDILKKDKCPLIPQIGGAKEHIPDWSDEMTASEIYELALLNMGYGLSTDAITQLSRNLGYKRKIIDLIAYVARTTCHTPAISTRFINVAKNLFLYYILKREKNDPKQTAAAHADDDPGSEMAGNVTDPTTTANRKRRQAANKPGSRADEWNQIIEAISTCAAEVAPIKFTAQCGIIDGFEHSACSDGRDCAISYVREAKDDELDLDQFTNFDLIIDSIWWMFSATYARCYSYFYPEEDVMLMFYQRFRDDILSAFMLRWEKAGQWASHFSIIFGPLSVIKEHASLRICASTAYRYEGLAGRQLVRPFNVTKDDVTVRNYKINLDNEFVNNNWQKRK